MQKPCDNCPFKISSQSPLGRDRRRDIGRSVLGDDRFGCHKTTTFAYGDQGSEYVYTEKERPCVGAAMFIQNVRGDCRANLAFRLYVGFSGWLKPEEFDRETIEQDIPKTLQDFVNAEEF